MATTNPIPTTHQDVVDQLSALKPKYDALMDADTKKLQAACGKIGHIVKVEEWSVGAGFYRCCVVCGEIHLGAKGGA